MRVERFGEEITFEEFLAQHGITLIAKERSKHSRLPRWFVSPEPLVEIRENSTLRGVSGNGDSPQKAKEEFARILLGHRLRIGGMKGSTVVAPNEWKKT